MKYKWVYNAKSWYEFKYFKSKVHQVQEFTMKAKHRKRTIRKV